ncbi:MAG: hypothetical protein ACQKBU_06560 [Verrucomicrobiales bacterium]
METVGTGENVNGGAALVHSPRWNSLGSLEWFSQAVGCLLWDMEKKGKMSGCGFATLIGALLIFGAFALVVFVFYGLWSHSDSSREGHSDEALMAKDHEAGFSTVEEGRLIFDESHWPVFPPLEEGEAVSRDRFLISMIDRSATELARETFLERADGALVEWSLKLVNLRKSGGSLEGTFEIGYGLRRGSARSFNQLQIEVIFAADQHDELLRLRKGDWVTIQGELSLPDRGNPVIRKARVVVKGEE